MGRKRLRKCAKSLRDSGGSFPRGSSGRGLTNYSLAAEQLNSLKKLVPKIFEDNLEKGKVALKKGDYSAAISSLTKAYAVKQDNFEVGRLLERAKKSRGGA